MKFGVLLILLIFISSFSSYSKQSLKLQGRGIYTFFLLDVYEATLWTSGTKNIYEGELNLQLKYKMNFEGKDIVKQTKKEFESAGVTSENSEKWVVELDSIFPDIKKGDSILASYKPFSGIKFYLNEKKFLGEVKDMELSKSFLDIWLGPKSSDPELRDRLLGVGNE